MSLNSDKVEVKRGRGRRKKSEIEKECEIRNKVQKFNSGIASTSRELGKSPAKETDSVEKYPSCWTRKQCTDFLKKYPWLTVKDQCIGCVVCRNVGVLAAYQKKNMHLSSNWQRCRVSYNGTTRASQQSSLRKKISKHCHSEAHCVASAIDNQTAQTEDLVQSIQENELETICRVFRIAYNIAKKHRPLSDLPDDVEMHILNGVEMCSVLHNDKSCAYIVKHIADEMKRKMAEDVVINKRKISLTIDELTTISQNVAMLVILKTCFDEQEASNFNLDLIELRNSSAESIAEAVLSCLYSYGFDEEFLRECLVCLTCDGASAVLGRTAGVANHFQKLFPKLIVWHCCNHRLEVAVSEVVEETNGINHFQIFFEKLYSHYQQSPKNRQEFDQIVSCLGSILQKIGKILTVQWVASTKTSVDAVINNYAALRDYFVNYDDINQMLMCHNFVHNLCLMADALDELADLSEFLQQKHTTMPQADKAVRTTLRVFESMVSNPGPKLSEAYVAIANGVFKGVPIKQTGEVLPIDQGMFFQSLANNLHSRLTCESKQHVAYSELLDNISILNFDKWPQAVDIQYGDKNVRKLCEKFSLDEKCVIRSFREFKMDRQNMPDDLKPLLSAVSTISLSTTECEHNLSIINDIMSGEQSLLDVPTVASLLFINSVGPPLGQFDPTKYMYSWLAKSQFLAQDIIYPHQNVDSDNIHCNFLWENLL